MYVKTSFIRWLQKQYCPFLDKRKICFKTEIWNGVVNKQQAEKNYRQPEKDEDGKTFCFCKGGNTGVHTVVGLEGYEMKVSHKFIKHSVTLVLKELNTSTDTGK